MRNSLKTHDWLSIQMSYILNVDYDEEHAIFMNINKYAFEKYALEKKYVPNFSPLVNSASLKKFEGVSIAYTRGDSLEWIDENLVQVGVANLLKACAEIESYNGLGRPYFFGKESFYNGKFREDGAQITVSNMLSIFTLYAWFLCFDVKIKNIEKITPFVAPEGLLIFVDEVLKTYQPSRTCGHSNPVSDILFDTWQEIMESNGDSQIQLIKNYLDNWAKLISPKDIDDFSVSSIGLFMRHSHVSNDTLPDETAGGPNPTYLGHWAWEVAFFVKFYGIDDSEFRDHFLYPVEMVDYKKK